MSSSKVYVYSQLVTSQPATLIGRLSFDGEIVRFDYRKQSNTALLTPYLLPSGTVTEKGFEGALSVFRDAGPGLWGRHVLTEVYGSLSMSELLVKSNNYLRIGNIRYAEQATDTLVFAPERTFTVNEIYLAFEKISDHMPLTEHDKKVVAQGSSIDGMQPKAFIELDDKAFLLKLPPSNTLDNKAANECMGLLLAKAVGLDVPHFRLVDLPNGKQALAVERFDRRGEQVLPLMSAATVMQFRGNDDFKKSYAYFSQALQQISVDFKDDQIKLFKQMILNIMISNRDDHIFNFSVLKTDMGWALSPVYDVVCGEGNHRGHAMNIGVSGRQGTLANAISQAAHFGLTKNTAMDIIQGMKQTIVDWRSIALDFGVRGKDVDAVAWSILNPDIEV